MPDYLKDPFEFGWRTGLRLRNIRDLQRRLLSKAEDGNYTITIPAEEFKRGVIHYHILADMPYRKVELFREKWQSIIKQPTATRGFNIKIVRNSNLKYIIRNIL